MYAFFPNHWGSVKSNGADLEMTTEPEERTCFFSAPNGTAPTSETGLLANGPCDTLELADNDDGTAVDEQPKGKPS